MGGNKFLPPWQQKLIDALDVLCPTRSDVFMQPEMQTENLQILGQDQVGQGYTKDIGHKLGWAQWDSKPQ